MTTEQMIETQAQKIQDYFFALGARVSKKDYEWLCQTLAKNELYTGEKYDCHQCGTLKEYSFMQGHNGNCKCSCHR